MGRTPTHDPELMESIVTQVIHQKASIKRMHEKYGIARSTIGFNVDKEKARLAIKAASTHKSSEFSVPDLPEEGRTAEEILHARKTIWKRVKDHNESRNIVDIKVNIDGPIAVATFGDPHLDDDGTDIDLFHKHMDIVKNTEGMFAINIGDVTNNWVGRLVAQHAHQSTTAVEAWKLAEWVFGYIPWLCILGGNHDVWSGDRDPLHWIAKHLGQPYINHGTRLRLNFPNGRKMIVNASHDYSGHSMYNPVHGGMKKAMRWADDVFVCGHRHHTGLGIVVSPIDNKLSIIIRADSYKVYDDYPKKLGIDETYLSPCPVVIMNPYAESERDKLLVVFDPDQAASILTHLRKEFKEKKAKKKK